MCIYQYLGHLFTVTQRKLSAVKQIFIFISYSAHFTASGLKAELSQEAARIRPPSPPPPPLDFRLTEFFFFFALGPTPPPPPPPSPSLF